MSSATHFFERISEVASTTPLKKPSIERIGDWSIQLSMETMQQEKLEFTLAHGVPFTMFHVSASQLQLICGAPCAVYLNNTALLSPHTQATAKAVSLVVRGHTYILVFDATHFIQFSGTSLIMSGVTRLFLVYPRCRHQSTGWWQILLALIASPRSFPTCVPSISMKDTPGQMALRNLLTGIIKNPPPRPSRLGTAFTSGAR